MLSPRRLSITRNVALVLFVFFSLFGSAVQGVVWPRQLGCQAMRVGDGVDASADGHQLQHETGARRGGRTMTETSGPGYRYNNYN